MHQRDDRAVGLAREEVFARYHTVIHLQTPPLNLGYNHSNPMRTESAEQAAQLCRRIEAVWEGHPNRLVVPATETFTEKLDHVTQLIHAALPAVVEAHKPSRAPRYLV